MKKDVVTYEVWERLANGTERRRPHDTGYPSTRIAGQVALEYNNDEMELRRMEMRKTGPLYFVVKATTSFENAI